MKPVHIRAKADHDIDQHFAWIAQDNPSAALRFLEAVKATCHTLSATPTLGSRRYAHLPLTHGIRMLAVKKFPSYLLFFFEYQEHIEIIRLLHGARDIPTVLQNEENS